MTFTGAWRCCHCVCLQVLTHWGHQLQHDLSPRLRQRGSPQGRDFVAAAGKGVRKRLQCYPYPLEWQIPRDSCSRPCDARLDKMATCTGL
jgi:hypothetical protein